jgi:ankyrin repeat protein
MSARRLPVRPDLAQLKHQAKELLQAIHRGDASAVAELREHLPKEIQPAEAKLADAQHVLARSYSASSWPRLVQACQLIDAIWRDDVDRAMALLTKHPKLLHENTTIRDSNWGPPMTYAANLGRDKLIAMMHKLGARDGEWALGRAVLQGKIQTARMLYEMLGSPTPPPGALAGPAYTLSVSGTAWAFEVGARIVGEKGVDVGTMEHLLGTDSRNPPAKHRILEMYVEHGYDPPDTPVMALHRGRIDLLERHLRRDPALLRRTFTLEEVFMPAAACYSTPYEAQGTPLDGTTLLHVAAYFDEIEIGEWLLDQGMDVDARSAVSEEGIGGYTALFSTVVSQPNFWVNYGKGKPDQARFTRLLLDRGADPNVRASLRARLGEGHGGGAAQDYRDVTPLSWGQRYHGRIFVSKESLRLVEERGGIP